MLAAGYPRVAPLQLPQRNPQGLQQHNYALHAPQQLPLGGALSMTPRGMPNQDDALQTIPTIDMGSGSPVDPGHRMVSRGFSAQSATPFMSPLSTPRVLVQPAMATMPLSPQVAQRPQQPGVMNSELAPGMATTGMQMPNAYSAFTQRSQDFSPVLSSSPRGSYNPNNGASPLQEVRLASPALDKNVRHPFSARDPHHNIAYHVSEDKTRENGGVSTMSTAFAESPTRTPNMNESQDVTRSSGLDCENTQIIEASKAYGSWTYPVEKHVLPTRPRTSKPCYAGALSSSNIRLEDTTTRRAKVERRRSCLALGSEALSALSTPRPMYDLGSARARTPSPHQQQRSSCYDALYADAMERHHRDYLRRTKHNEDERQILENKWSEWRNKYAKNQSKYPGARSADSPKPGAWRKESRLMEVHKQRSLEQLAEEAECTGHPKLIARYPPSVVDGYQCEALPDKMVHSQWY